LGSGESVLSCGCGTLSSGELLYYCSIFGFLSSLVLLSNVQKTLGTCHLVLEILALITVLIRKSSIFGFEVIISSRLISNYLSNSVINSLGDSGSGLDFGESSGGLSGLSLSSGVGLGVSFILSSVKGGLHGQVSILNFAKSCLEPWKFLEIRLSNGTFIVCFVHSF
jgi:hypothetical protein